MRRGKKEERPTNHEVNGGDTHDVRDESGGAKGCLLEDRDVWRKLTKSIARTLRVEGTR